MNESEFSLALNSGWAGVIIGLLGVGFAVYQVLRRSGPQLIYQHRGQRLIKGGNSLLPDEIVVQYDGETIPRVSLSQVVIWNAGHGPVRGSDIVSKDPITFDFGENARILIADVDRSTRAANEAGVQVEKKKPGCVRFGFAFMDRGDGALLRVLHTGTKTVPSHSGTIIGMPSGLISGGRIPATASARARRIRPDLSKSERILTDAAFLSIKYYKPMLAIVSIVVFLIGAFPRILLPFGIEVDAQVRYAYIFVGLVYGAMSFALFWLERRRFPSALLPDDLRGDGENESSKESGQPT